ARSGAESRSGGTQEKPSLEDLLRRPAEDHGTLEPVPLPRDLELASAKPHARLAVAPAGERRRNERRARARPAGERLAAPALPYAHVDLAARAHDDELGVRPLGKPLVTLEERAPLVDRKPLERFDSGPVRRVDSHDRVRIPHRQ